jgi:hypothetical protein
MMCPESSPQEPPLPTEGAVLLGGEDGLETTAKKLGIICRACANPMDDGGFEFIQLDPQMSEDGPIIRIQRAFICTRASCAQARENFRGAATAYRPAPAWTVPDGSEEDGSGD